MFFLLSDKFVAISQTNEDKDLSIISLFDLKTTDKSQISIDLKQFESNEDKNSDQKESDKNGKINYSLICGHFSKNSKHLAVCDNRKNLIVFKDIDNNWKQIFKSKVSRNCIHLFFSLNNNSVICGHKSGDVFEYDFEIEGNESLGGRLLLGHCSMLLDLIQTQDSKYLITSDRDEKIRVSYYPNTYNIESYCLGHKEFVSSIDTIDNKTLISGSGDGSLRIWNISDGKQLEVLTCDPNETIEDNHKNGTQFPVKKLVTDVKSGAKYLAVSFYKQSIVKIYSIDSLSLKLIHTLSLSEEPIDILFDVLESDVLWILLPKCENPIEIYKISSDKTSKVNIYENVVKQLNSNECFGNQCLNESKTDELSGLYKHWFNNVETYLQKKNERQEVMAKKKKFTRL